jgi:hypothetical protein
MYQFPGTPCGGGAGRFFTGSGIFKHTAGLVPDAAWLDASIRAGQECSGHTGPGS